ncbi:MAG: hypothetical protein EPN31_15845 [Castellaniella sp.]|uniref:hypothetical protein n=1 Tax=Castellaniella sp. TaxID=1955812 RepID=UPI001202F75D|nr:hypothetical protein [Castellaniella sp.]TAN25152.1 MAG: hypothetical protein EPN31_15845 [Castellaniella sp.]
MLKLTLNEPQRDAVMAGLRLLQRALDLGEVAPNDGNVGDILTCSGRHEGMTSDQIDSFIENTLNS